MIFARKTAHYGTPEADAKALFRGRTQPAAVRLLDSARAHKEFRSENDDKLAFAGAFGYDLLFQFEPIPLRLTPRTRKDLQLFLCDDIIYMDRKRESRSNGSLTNSNRMVSPRAGMARTATGTAGAPSPKPGPITSDHTPEEYMANVEIVREGMRQGDYYEVVLRQTFRTPYSGKASELFHGCSGPIRAPTSF